MSREIKFRFFDIINKNMIYPSNKIFLNMNGKIVYESSIDGEIVEALDGTYELMQYTGLKDKNGVEIYEGDILKNAREKSIYEVKWIDRDCRFGLIYNFIKTYEGEPIKLTRDDIPMNRIPDCEVIGNIYENKELLKGETK